MWSRVVTLAAGVVVTAALTIGTAAAAGVLRPTGPVRVVNPAGSTLRAGGSSTPFSLEVPAGAACPGDTAHHDYLVYSYLTPEGRSPGGLTFPGGYPSSGLDLITASGDPYVTNATAVNTGSVLALPIFNFTRYDHQMSVLPPGTYNVGVACAHAEGAVVRYWNTTMSFVADAHDPGGFTWHVVSDASTRATGSSDTSLIVGIAIAVAAVAAVAFMITARWRRVSRQQPRDASGV